MGFLRTYGLEKDFKLNIEPNHTTMAGHAYEHDIVMSSAYGLLGSIDANTGSPDLGWDTDQFVMSVDDATRTMLAVVKQGGLAPGGLNFDAKPRRESTDIEDLFIAHIGAMDTFARGLKNAAALLESRALTNVVAERYRSYDSGIGARIEQGKADFDECERFITQNGMRDACPLSSVRADRAHDVTLC